MSVKEKLLKLQLTDIAGIGPSTAQKLADAGVETPADLLLATDLELLDIGIPRHQLLRIREGIRSAVGIRTEMSSQEYRLYRSKLPRLPTGVKSLDALLGGGLMPGELVEVAGEYGAGKSQLAFQLSVMATLPPDKGGAGGLVYYLDTEGTYSPERVLSIARRFEAPPEAVENGIIVVRSPSADEQVALTRMAARRVLYSDVKLIVVDSLTAQFRAEYVGREVLAPRQQAINVCLDTLKRIAYYFGVYVLVTNQVMAVPDRGGLERPAGGHVVGHAATHRLLLTKVTERKDDARRKASVIDSPYLPPGDCMFKIGPDGLHDV